jgi:chorismate mutase
MTTVADQRSEIDALDAQLVALIRQRLAVSAEIQHARLAAGGPRVVHAREAEVVAHWRAELGSPGSRIALALLELSRGSVVAL